MAIQCGICTQPVSSEKISAFEAGELNNTLEPVSTKCNHIFHQSCLKTMIETVLSSGIPTCPTCDAMLFPVNILTAERLQGLTSEQFQQILPQLSITQLKAFTDGQKLNISKFDLSHLTRDQFDALFKNT